MFEQLWEIIDEGFIVTISKSKLDCYEVEYSKQVKADEFHEGTIQSGTLAEAVTGMIIEIKKGEI